MLDEYEYCSNQMTSPVLQNQLINPPNGTTEIFFLNVKKICNSRFYTLGVCIHIELSNYSTQSNNIKFYSARSCLNFESIFEDVMAIRQKQNPKFRSKFEFQTSGSV